MRVIVTSGNPVKIKATTAAFQEQFPNEAITVESLAVDSGVSDQPMDSEETLTGAENRVTAAKAAEPDADYWVGLEGGLSTVAGELQTSAWMVIGDRHGRTGRARSASLPLPGAIKEHIDAGLELGDANDRVFATHNSKHAGGAFGLLTEGRMTRESIYTQTLLLALIPLTHPLFEKPDEQ